MTIEELQNILKEKGVVGAGGAGFPTYAKLYNGAKYLIMNAAECEPLFKIDQELIKNYTYEILKGFSIIIETLKIPKGIISLKESYNDSIEALEGHLGFFKNIEIKKLKDTYPLGDELVLIYESVKESIPQGNIPRSKGVIVINVETAFNVYKAVIKHEPVTESYLTVSGDIKEPKSFSVPIGVKVKDILNKMQIIVDDEKKIIIGGPMTGKLGTLDTIITKTTKGILILPKYKKVCTSQEGEYKQFKNQSFSACSQCQMCTDLCPRSNLGYDIKPHKIMNSVIYENNYLNLMGVFSCCECNLCTLYSCHQGLNPMRIIRELKERLRAAGLKAIEKEVIPTSDREYRKVPGKSLKQRIGLIYMDKKAPLIQIELKNENYYINLQQHIGAKSIPIVNVGQKIEKDEIIGRAEKGLSVNIHSPVKGEIIEISENYILIKRGESR